MAAYSTQLKSDYLQKGWLGPLPVFNSAEIERYRELALKADADLKLMKTDYRCKSQVLFPWVNEIIRNPVLTSYIEQLIGPNFHCWDVLFWIKHPEEGKTVSFHQDATYWNFDQKHKAVSAWLAFNDVTPDQGPLEYVDDSHTFEQRTHLDIRTGSNLLMRGQTVDEPIAKTTSVPTPAGHVLLHSPYVVHGSGANTSSVSRIACGMIFVSTECRPIVTKSPESTVMVHGQDHYNHMLHDPEPGADWQTNYRNWRLAYDRQHDNYYSLNQEASL
jgi:non-haem Fe2+, alpha-ketoglutarate-dependent halogenase